MFSKPTALLLILASPGTSWTTSAYMNLVSPPRWTTDIGDAYIIKAGEIQPGYGNHLGSCLNKPVPTNVTRTPFPITGGSLLLSFTNATRSPNPDPADEKFKIDMYLTDDHADYSQNSFFRWGGLKRMQYWQGFETGWTCSVGFDMKSRLRQPGNESAVAMLEGLNVTIALLVSVGRGPYRGDPNWAGDTWEEVDQCAYVTLTSSTSTTKRALRPRDPNQDMCNRVNLDYFGTPTPTTSALPTATSSAATEKMIRSRAADLLVGVAIVSVVTVVLSMPFR